MKRILLLLVVIITLSLNSFAQVPEGFSYQAVIRNSVNLTLDNNDVGMQLKIREGSITGTVVYTETFATSTNSYGLVNLEIGSGTSADDFSAIAWATNGPFFIETAVDETGGTSYVVMGTSKLMSVAYAFHAKTSGNGAGPQGLAGTNGIDGATGPAGPVGLVVTAGANGNDGADGAAGADGNPGAAGANGNDGTNGTNGTNGTDATNFWTESGSNVYRNLGNVGIGTSSPQFPLHVTASNSGASNISRSYLKWFAQGASWNSNWSSDLVSIYTTGAIMSNTYIAASDKRIKDITGISKSKDDLTILSSIEVTDYKMKDKVKYGETTTKKVIAQQLKSVYPQAVSLQTDVIPDIYKISEIKEGYIKLETDLKKGDKVKFIFDDNEEVVEVLSTDKNGFTVDNKKEGKVFVFGKEVDDFHVVDYDAVSMLNVSATQELYKLILKQQKTIEKQNEQIDLHKTQISAQIEESKKTQSDFDERINNLENLFNISKLND